MQDQPASYSLGRAPSVWVAQMLTPFEEELVVGTRFADRFQILGVVGRGSMGVVYQARHELMGRVVAIKMLRGQLQLDERTMRRFEREARAASRMDHPNLISVHDFGLTDNRQPYLVMDFAQGSTLYEIQRREDHLTPVRAVKIFTQVCDALQHAHFQGVIHRDLKPSNIMIIEKDGEPDFVKVFDLGIAKIAWGEEEDKEPLTSTNEVCGSPIYLSPEQCKHETLDARSDIYSLGVVMYELLTGVPPLMGETVYDTIYMHVHEDPRSFGDVRPDLHIPNRLERIVAKALAKHPDDRYQSMQELKWELQASLQASDPHLKVLPPEALMATKRKQTQIETGPPERTPSAAELRSGRTPSFEFTPVTTMNTSSARTSRTPAAAFMSFPEDELLQEPDEPSRRLTAGQAAVMSSVASVLVTLGVVGFLVASHKQPPSADTTLTATTAPATQSTASSAQPEKPAAQPPAPIVEKPVPVPAQQPIWMVPMPVAAPVTAVQPVQQPVATVSHAVAEQQEEETYTPPVRSSKKQSKLNKKHGASNKHTKPPVEETAETAETPAVQQPVQAEQPKPAANPLAAFFQGLGFGRPAPQTVPMPMPAQHPQMMPAHYQQAMPQQYAAYQQPQYAAPYGQQPVPYGRMQPMPQQYVPQQQWQGQQHVAQMPPQMMQPPAIHTMQNPHGITAAAAQPQAVPMPQPASTMHTMSNPHGTAQSAQPAPQLTAQQQPQAAQPAASNIPSDEAIAANNEGVALITSNPVAAISKFKAALDLSPNYTNAKRNLGRALFNLGNRERANQKLSEAAKDYRAAFGILSNIQTSEAQHEAAVAKESYDSLKGQ